MNKKQSTYWGVLMSATCIMYLYTYTTIPIRIRKVTGITFDYSVIY